MTNHTPGPWSFSPQNGRPGHCFQAQVWDNAGKCLAIIEPTATANEATANAKAISNVPHFMEAANIMTAAEDAGGDLWWKGFELLKTAFKNAGGEFATMDRTPPNDWRDIATAPKDGTTVWLYVPAKSLPLNNSPSSKWKIFRPRFFEGRWIVPPADEIDLL